jgi:hypothetical protein
MAHGSKHAKIFMVLAGNANSFAQNAILKWPRIFYERANSRLELGRSASLFWLIVSVAA